MKSNVQKILAHSNLQNRGDVRSRSPKDFKVQQRSPNKHALCIDKSFHSFVTLDCVKTAEDRVRLNKSHLVCENKEPFQKNSKRCIEPNQKIIGRIAQNLKLLQAKFNSVFAEEIEEEKRESIVKTSDKGKKISYQRDKTDFNVSIGGKNKQLRYMQGSRTTRGPQQIIKSRLVNRK